MLIASSMLVDRVRTETPCCVTAGGRRGVASAMRFCTFTWAIAGSAPTAKVTVSV